MKELKLSENRLKDVQKCSQLIYDLEAGQINIAAGRIFTKYFNFQKEYHDLHNMWD